ncbi:OadG family protein [Caldanaerobius polysaccharolyticus]|uniref:OadG family protein n=1 Tax=Caldanaerobius polysaccharolyticus TaxID=44256 RepID=UPI00047EF9AB|nr:OadG family protein [Caldanaerobius polysaccharolyticus]
MSFIQLLGENALITVLGMGIVFAVLIILCLVILLFKYAFVGNERHVEKPKVNDRQDEKDAKEQGNDMDEELIAVISAAIASYGKSDFKLKIRSLRKTGQAPTWAKAGRNDIINSRI